MAERDRKEAADEEYKCTHKPAWAIVMVQNILDNLYIGTLRQGKYTRKKINGKDVLRDEEEIVIEKHYQPIIDYCTFTTTQALREKRITSHYRGAKSMTMLYTGFLVCGDCSAHMFVVRRGDLKSAYTCSTCHHRGQVGCTSHCIRTNKLDELLKSYVPQVMDHSKNMLNRLNRDLAQEQEDVQETGQGVEHLEEEMEEPRRRTMRS